MKRLLAIIGWLVMSLVSEAATMQTASTTNDLVLLNPYSINTNVFTVSDGGTGPDGTSTVWTFILGDASAVNSTNLAPTLYPTSGRWKKNLQSGIGTNVFNTLVVTNLTVITNLSITTNTYVIDNNTNTVGLWIETNSTLRPLHLDLPVMITNSLSFSEGMTNVLYRDGQDLVYSNKLGSNPSYIRVKGTNSASASFGVTASGATTILAGSSQPIWMRPASGVFGDIILDTAKMAPDVDNFFDLGGSGNNTAWKDSYFKGKHYIVSTNDGVGNSSWMKIYSTNGVGIFDLANAGTGFAPDKFSFRTNGVEVFSITGTGGSGGSLTITNSLTLQGSFAQSVGVGGTVTLGDTNDVYLCNVDAQLVTLPTAVGKRGRNYTVKLIAPATTGTVTNFTGAELIDGATAYSLTSSNKYVHVIGDGTNWWIMGNN
jgi:hypothetical protein